MTVFLISICIPPTIPLTFVFNFPWVFQWSQAKLKTMLKQLFRGGGGGGVGVWGVRVYYGQYANGKLIKYLYLLSTSSPVLFPQKMERGTLIF